MNMIRFFLLICLQVILAKGSLANPALSFNNSLLKSFPAASGEPRPAGLYLVIDSIHHVNCLLPAGYLAVRAEGGNPGYTYAWSNGLTGSVATNLAPGTYSVTVTDVLGETASVSATIAEDLAAPSADAGADFQAQCANSVLPLSGAGSAGPGYQYLWTASGGGAIQSGANTLSPVINHTGTFTLKVTNSANGCTTTDAVTVGAIYQPPVAVVTGGAVKCSNPQVTLGASLNFNNIQYGWQGPNGYASSLLNPQVAVPGTYVFVATDTVSACTGAYNAMVTIDTIRPTAAASGGGVITCALPTLTLSGNGGPAGVTFSWTGPNGYASSQQNPVVSAAGKYVLTVLNPQNGCTATGSTQVTVNTTPPTAFAGVNGSLTCAVNSVQLSGNGGPAGVTFSWSGPNGYTSNLQSPAVNTAGTYTLTVKNPQNGCTASASATVSANVAPPGATATGGLKTCASPTVALNAASNTAGVNYAWSGPGNFFSTQKSPSVSLTGTYTVTVTNPANGCSSTATATVTQNVTPPTLSTTSATITCNTPNPQIKATSQTPGATFAWTGPNGFTAGVSNPNVSTGGYYNVTVTSPANGCTSQSSVYVEQNTTPPFVYAGSDRSLNCYYTSILTNPIGTSSGSNFTYLWTTWNGHIVLGANTLYARVDSAGTYTLTVKNTQNGCTAVDSMEVIKPLPVSVSAVQLAAISCNGGSNGSAKATGSGGVGTFGYSWSTGAKTAIASNLAAGTYTVTVVDEETCSATSTVTVTQPALLQATVTTTPQTMAGVNNGTATVAGTGGTVPYTYKWNTGATNFTIANLAPGTYTATVTDLKGCTTTKTGTVNAVNCSVSGTVAATAVSCFGGNNGSATANVTGGAGTIKYLWSNGAITKTASSLTAGNYTVTVTDGNGCSVVLSTQIAAPQQLTAAIASQTNVLCPGAQTGAATLSISGGTTPYVYAWSNGAANATINNLGAGAYTCTVTDAKGCSKSQAVQITVTDNQPPQLNLKNAAVTLNAGGQATVTAAMFDNGSTDQCGIANWTVSPSTFDCEQIGTRIVTLTATDQKGNSATATAMVTITDNIQPALTCPQNVLAASCNPVVNFSLPQVSDNCPVSSAATLQSGLPSGSAFPVGVTQQIYTFSDKSGNSATCSFTVTVPESLHLTVAPAPASCAAACNGSAQATTTGGAAPLQFAWSNGSTGASASGLCPGSYTVTVSDAAGCSQQQTVSVSAQNGPVFTVSNTISPVSCGATCDGTVSLSVSGNPASILWSNGQSGASLSGLCPGDYAATLTDAAGCSVTHAVQIPVVDTQAPVLACPGNLSAGACKPTVSFALPTVTDDCPADPLQLQLIAGLPSGSAFPVGVTVQTYRYTDLSGNAGECSFNVTVFDQPSLKIDQIVKDHGAGDGSISISVTGGLAPFTYKWSLNGVFYANTEDLTGLISGQYAVTVIDAAGCSVSSAGINVGVSVATEEPEAGWGWTLYPNPATAEVYLKVETLFPGDLDLQIFDAAGRLLRRQEITNPGSEPVRIDLDGLPDGWLLFRLSGEKGVRTKTLVKSR